jgi:DNA repair exonuclease SbcCD ATPase subunit
MHKHTTFAVRSLRRSALAAFAGVCLTTALPSAALAQDGAPAKPAQGDDILKGPSVSERDLKDSERFTGRERAGKAPVSKPAMELRVLGAALDEMTLSAETKAKVNEVRAAYIARVEAYEAEARAAKKKLAEERAKTPAGEPPSEDFKKRAEALEARRPKLAELKAELEKVLSPAEVEDLKTRFADGMQKAREEMTRREEAARKAKREAIEREKAKKDAGEPGQPMQGDEPMQGAPKR